MTVSLKTVKFSLFFIDEMKLKCLGCNPERTHTENVSEVACFQSKLSISLKHTKSQILVKMLV
jgi:hypothetical protein